MPPLARQLFALFALLAVSTAQVMGIGTGWLCHCSGRMEFSAAATCAAADCHDNHHGDSGESRGCTHEHEPLREPLHGVNAAIPFPAPPVLLEWILPEWLQPLPEAGQAVLGLPREARPPPEPARTCRHRRVSVATSMVLLV